MRFYCNGGCQQNLGGWRRKWMDLLGRRVCDWQLQSFIRQLEEGKVLYWVMLAISCPELCVVCHRSRGDQRVGDFDAMALSVLSQIGARLKSGVSVNRTQVGARKRLFMASNSLGRAPAQSSATLTGEYRTAAPELLDSSHLEMISAFLPRETSIRMPESTRTVISSCGADPAGYHGEGSARSSPHPRSQSSPCGFQRTPAWP